LPGGGLIAHDVRSIAGIGNKFKIVRVTKALGLDVMTARIVHVADAEITTAVTEEIRARCDLCAAVEVLPPGPGLRHDQPKRQQRAYRRANKLDKKTADADRRAAAPAAAAEPQPAKNWNKVKCGQPRTAGRAITVSGAVQADAARQPIAGAVDERAEHGSNRRAGRDPND
jgi:hypothetical protein